MKIEMKENCCVVTRESGNNSMFSYKYDLGDLGDLGDKHDLNTPNSIQKNNGIQLELELKERNK